MDPAPDGSGHDNSIYLNELLNRLSTSSVPEKLSLPRKGAATLSVIIGFKILKGLTLLLIAFGLYHVKGKNLGVGYDSLLRLIRLDSEAGFFGPMGHWLDSISLPLKAWIVPSILAYGLFSFVEACGLWLRSTWGGWLAIAESAFFIPIEIYELVSGFSWTVFSILVTNVVIVVYLFWNRHRLFSHHH